MSVLRNALACLLLLLTAAGQPTPQQVQEAERAKAAQLEAQQASAARAAAAAGEEKRLATLRVQAAAKMVNAERATNAAAERVAELVRRREAAAAALTQRAENLGPMLPVIERLSLYPSETLLAVPMPAEQSIRGLLVLGGLAKRLEADATALRAEQDAVTALRAQVEAELPKLAAAQATQAAQAANLDAQIQGARAVQRAAEDAGAEAARRAAAEGARADSLKAAIARIEAERKAEEARAKAEAEAAARRNRTAEADAARARQALLAKQAGPGVGEAKGQLTAPVAGSIVRGFGDVGESGTSSGLSYQSAPSARVVSPCAGRIVFAGPFRSFGLLLIVDCGGGTHVVLSGLERLDGQVGQAVPMGEPVGVMPAWDATGAARRPLLYVELRRDGVAINPTPFLRARG